MGFGLYIFLSNTGHAKVSESVFLHTFINVFPQILFMAKGEIGRSIEQLKNAKGSDKAHVAFALGEARASSAVPALIEALKDNSWYVRSSVVAALGKIKDIRAVDVLIEHLMDRSWTVREHAAVALANIGDARAVLALIEALKDEDWHARENAGWLHDRGTASWALGVIADNCKTIEEVERIEKAIIEGSKTLRKRPYANMIEIYTQLRVVDLLKKIAEKKNELAPKRDLLLPDTIKAPKKGGIYSSMRKMRAF